MQLMIHVYVMKMMHKSCASYEPNEKNEGKYMMTECFCINCEW